MSTSNAEQQYQAARTELAKLPTLGPVIWLYARDPQRKYTFAADVDWRLLPPLVLNQCKVYTKEELPWAYFSWAFVSDTVHERLQQPGGTIAPHEWNSGNHPWLIDAVMPFGGAEYLLNETVSSVLQTEQVQGAEAVSVWLPNEQGVMQLASVVGN